MKTLAVLACLIAAGVAEAQDEFFATAPWMQPNGGNLVGDWNRGATITAYGPRYSYQATGIQPRNYRSRNRGRRYGRDWYSDFRQTQALEQAALELRLLRQQQQLDRIGNR